MRFSQKDGAALLAAGGIGCAVFTYLAINDGDSMAMWMNGSCALYCWFVAVQLWRR